MRWEVLFIAFQCLFCASIICNVAMPIVNAAEDWSYGTSRNSIHNGYHTTNGTDPNGDPIDDPPSGPSPWPQ